MEQLISVRSLFKETDAYAGKQIKVGGWVRNLRASKNFGFINLSDGTFFSQVQVVYGSELANFTEISKLNIGAAVIVTGTLVLTPDAKQPFELQASEVFVEGPSTPDYPIQPKRHSMEYLRTVTHLRPRTNTFQAVFRVRSLIAYAIHKFFQERDFVYVHTPLITGSDCEGAGEMFQVTTMDLNRLPKDKETGKVDFNEDFFGKAVNLTVSGQLEAETHACALGSVYTFGPTFRAEKSNTTRHLSEFWMIEPEIAFADLQDNADIAEDYLRALFTAVLDECPEDLRFCDQRIEKGLLDRLERLADAKFARISYDEAIQLLAKNQDAFEFKPYWGADLQSEHERFLAEKVFNGPVTVMNYPKEIKAFYMRQNDDGKTVAAMDVLLPDVGEIIGGSQREERLELLEARIRELGMDPENYWWYLDLRRFGSVPHSGFGLGFERMVRFCTGMGNIRDVIPFPRAPREIEF